MNTTLLGHTKDNEHTVKVTGTDGCGYFTWPEAYKIYGIDELSYSQTNKIFSDKGLDLVYFEQDGIKIVVNIKYEGSINE